jgi:hypothetical protein
MQAILGEMFLLGGQSDHDPLPGIAQISGGNPACFNLITPDFLDRLSHEPQVTSLR